MFRALILDGALLTAGLTACDSPTTKSEAHPPETAVPDSDSGAPIDTADTCPSTCNPDNFGGGPGAGNWAECFPASDLCCWTNDVCCDLCCENW